MKVQFIYDPKKSVFQLKEGEGPWGVGMALAGVAVITAPAWTLLPPRSMTNPLLSSFSPSLANLG